MNAFIDELQRDTFEFTPKRVRLLTGYVTMLFHRSRARRDASPLQQERMVAALKSLRADYGRLDRLAVKMMTDLFIAGTPQVVTIADGVSAIDREIVKQTAPGVAQCRYLGTMETMMGFVDERMRDGEWRILRTEAAHPFVLGDAPVVTWERNSGNTLVHGQGFARPNVEVFLPIFPIVCLHVLPAVQRTQPVVAPSIDEVNRAHARFAKQHCFANVMSTEIDALVQPEFGTFRLGIEGFNADHINAADQLFSILMKSTLPQGKY